MHWCDANFASCSQKHSALALLRFKNTYQSGFLSILYSIGSKPLQIWDKKVRNGHIKRLTDSDIQSSVLEIMGTNVSTTYITCPADPSKTLGIKLPFLVMIIKNLKKYFTFEVTVLDDKEVRRRFRASNYQSTTRIQFNLSDFTRRAYGTNYIETLRVQLHANCRIRRIYFSDRLYSEEELRMICLWATPAGGTEGAKGLELKSHPHFTGCDVILATSQKFVLQNADDLGGLTPVVSMAAETAVLLPDGTASLNVSGRQLNITQHVPLSPLQLRAKTAWQVAGAATGFVAYNGSGLGQLQLDQMQTMGCASIFLDQQVALPVQLLEVRCAAQLQHLAVELPGHDREDLENHILKVCLTVLQLLGTTFGNTAVQALDGFISQRGRSIVNEILERMLSQPSACPASNYSSGEIGSIALPSSWGSGVCLSIMALLFIAYLWPVLSHCAMHNVGDSATSSSRSPVRCWSTRGQTTSPSSVPETEESSQSLQAGCHPDLSNDSFRLGKGLGWQPGVSPFLRWGILSGIAGTTLLFVYASVTPGILLSGSFKASNGSSDTRHMASLSMDNSLVQTWSVGSYFVFCAMLIFSVLWPYVKLLMMMYAWVTPMDHGIRGPMLIFLDQIGKWSLMDNIILFLFIVFFWISWTGEDTVEGGEASFGLKCSPEDELNTFLAATILSLLLGHAMLWIHRWQNSKLDGAGGEACIQSGHDARRLRVVGAGHITCFLLMVLSWQVEIVEVTFSGLVGTFLEVTHQPMSKRYSILGILSCLGKQGSKYLQVTFAIFVLAIPMLQLLAMTFICLYQLHPKRRQQLLRLCYTLRAWAAYDVFLLAFLAAVLGGDRYGIGQYIELIVYKQNLAPTCRIFRDMGIECLHIRLGFLPGTIIIVAAVALSYVVSLLVARETRPG
ncbi:Cfap20 [Symbiodinium pilosum]|uniref:Cfap20 protein n=1 Tax=Symbiodinium pilosum TaxID=2952 RepID=A0A812K6C8_SYMPI|nr:Cfap20 [Symbiodinium pilosum]